MNRPGETSWDTVRELCEKVLEGLDWQALGELYFHENGEEHWRERIPHVLEFGLDQARALLRRVPAEGASLHVGAGVAELPVVLAERLVRGRRVRAVNRRRAECDLLHQGLRRAGLTGVVRFDAVDAGEAAAAAGAGGYDHLACVSLFTDPESWPELSGVAYGRIAPVQLDVERFVAQRTEARALAQRLFAGLAVPGWITTTPEEVAWFLAEAAAAGCRVDADEELLPSAVVGDPIGFLHVVRG